MSDEDLPPLDHEVATLLAAEKPIPVAPPGAKARVTRRIEATLFGGPPGGGSTSGPSGEGPRSPPVSPVAPAATTPRPRLPSPSRFAASLGAAFVIGGLVGAAGLSALRPTPPPTIVYVERPAVIEPRPATTPAVIETPPPTLGAVAASAPEPRPLPGPNAAPARSATDTLGEERALLDVARTALGRSAGEDALVALGRDQQRFPRGALSEEREALFIQAQVLVGNDEGARGRANLFRKRYPGSILAPAVDAVVDPIFSQDAGAHPR